MNAWLQVYFSNTLLFCLFDLYKLRGQLPQCFKTRHAKWIIKALQELALLSILIYGNIIFYSKEGYACKQKDPQNYWLMQLLLAIGYFYFLIVAIMIFICVLSVILTLTDRLQRHRNKHKYRKIMKKLKKIRYSPFAPEFNQECSICWSDFEVRDEIVVMTCDERHQFHTACLEQWVKRGSKSCPICRTEIGSSIEMPAIISS